MCIVIPRANYAPRVCCLSKGAEAASSKLRPAHLRLVAHPDEKRKSVLEEEAA